ncbi:nucleoside-diphosphate sugar epimerase/dehydratase, partial [Microbacterium sp. bgisy207]|uniref:nucleoside-diphosphate sugar epimerase/dehydratase n=1 Tax=Microbacterium sp. bgisy207 TaxID=3413800 RepID=UPI003EBC1D7A
MYTRRLWISDLIVLVWVVFGTQIFWFGTGNAALAFARDGRLTAISYWFASALLVALWWWALSLADSRSYRVIGTGSSEYIRVIDSSIRLFGMIAIVAFLFQVDIARGYLLISLPLGIIMLVLVRWLWRHWLFAKRYNGQYMSRVLLVGSESSVAQIASELQRAPRA